MNFTVKIRNYQRIKKADIDFVPGLNVVVGASNQGKTAIIRAVSAAIFNTSRDSHVTVGESVAVVGIRYRDREVIWRRDLKKASKTSYLIDGETYQKIGRTQLPEVAEALGISETDIEGVSERLNFQKQMAYPFLLDKPSSQIFRFMAGSAETDDLFSVLSDMKSDQAEMIQSIKNDESAVDAFKAVILSETEMLGSLLPKVPVAEMVVSMDAEFKSLDKLSGDVENLRRIQEAWATYSPRLVVMRKRKEFSDPLITEIAGLLGCVDTLTGIVGNLYKYSVRISEAFTSVDKLRAKDISRMLPAETDVTQAVELDKLCDRLRANQATAGDVTGQVGKLSEQCAVLGAGLSAVCVELEELDTLGRLLQELRVVLGKESDIGIEKAKVAEALVEVERGLSEFDVCPFCGAGRVKE